MAENSKAVKLVHVTTIPITLWAFFGGQIGYMKARGFEVHAISSPGDKLDRFAQREQVPVCAVQMPRGITPFRDLVALFQLWRHFRKIRPQIVHSHTPKGGLLGMLAAWLARVPVRIYHLHGLRWVTCAGLKRKILMWTEKIACRLAHRVLCVSPSVRQVAVQVRLCPAEKVKVLINGSTNGVDAIHRFNPKKVSAMGRAQAREQWGIHDGSIVVGFVGRVVRDKGVEELATAWSVLRDEFPKLHMLLVGPFETEDPISGKTEQLLRSDVRMHLTGMQEDMPPLYAAMDILVLPTYREGFPVVPLEAAAMGLPVIGTTAVGCVDAVEDNVTGTLVPPRDPQALAGAIATYVRDPDLRRRHGQAARERALRDFRPEPIWEALYQEYVRLLREKGLPVPHPAPQSKEEAALSQA